MSAVIDLIFNKFKLKNYRVVEIVSMLVSRERVFLHIDAGDNVEGEINVFALSLACVSLSLDNQTKFVQHHVPKAVRLNLDTAWLAHRPQK